MATVLDNRQPEIIIPKRISWKFARLSSLQIQFYYSEKLKIPVCQNNSLTI